jgi:hypothetical protein
MEQPENGELKDGSPVAAHGVPPLGMVCTYLDDISYRYLGSIYRVDGPSIGDRSPDGNRSFTCAPFVPDGRLESGREPTYAENMAARENLAARRLVVDYALARRATLASVHAGRTTIADVCDAHPYLLRAAKHHGEPTEDPCPICRKTNVTHVTYVYGDELGQYAGRVKRGPELTEMAAEYGEFRVYVVEVCQSCAWHHLATSYVLGTGEPPAGRRRRVRPN